MADLKLRDEEEAELAEYAQTAQHRAIQSAAESWVTMPQAGKTDAAWSAMLDGLVSSGNLDQTHADAFRALPPDQRDGAAKEYVELFPATSGTAKPVDAAERIARRAAQRKFIEALGGSHVLH
jgi:hypothetical protein